MKKKLCYYLIIVLALFSFNSVLAEENSCEGLEESDLPTLHLSPISDADIKKFFGAAFGGGDRTYYNMTLDGYKALCLKRGKPARSGDKYKYAGTIGGDKAKALTFYISGDYPGLSMYKWAIAQYFIWHEWDASGLGEILSRDDMLSFKYGYMSTEQKRQLVRPMLENQPDSVYYKWINITRDGQPVITPLKGCNPPSPEEETCPKGEMVKQNASLTCAPSKKGIQGTFTYTASPGDRTNVSYASETGAKGEELVRIGSYCRLYCQESATATLPGAIGEALQLGSYMIWPTSVENKNAQFYETAYPLRFEGTLECKIGVVPDSGLPIGCEEDPEKEFYYDYKSLEGKWDDDTYERVENTKLEKMRLDITPLEWATADAPPSRAKIETACTNAYEKDYTVEIYKYSKAKDLLREAKEALRLAIEAEKGIDQKKQTKWCTYAGTQINYPCGEEDTPEYANAKKVTKDAQEYVKEKEEIVTSIENHIQACVNYTSTFEHARHILKDYKDCAEFKTDANLYAFSSGVTFNYKDEYYNTGSVGISNTSSQIEGGEGDETLFDDSIESNGLTFEGLAPYKQTAENTGNLTDKVNAIQSRSIIIKKSETYSLMTKYKYIDKESKKYLYSPVSGTNYSTVLSKLGVIPTYYDNKVAVDDKYYLTLSNISFGMAGFTNASGSDYKCPVEFTKSSNKTCKCPEGTKMEGLDLVGIIADEKITCADAQLKYCDDDIEEKPTPYCDPPMDHISLAPCINAGYTESECKAMPGVCKTYKCKNTNSVFGEMDITSCVQTKIAQGLSETQAFDYCDKVVCPLGKTIIYRTIRLENPFPSYDPSQNLYNGLTTGMFNNNTKGRYPGYNWNGILTVYNKIRNNRSGRLEKNESTAINKNTTIGTTIYQTKEPLYTFVLDGGTIREIRRYNESRVDGYNDFNSSKENNNMDCKINNSIACVSAFVHDPSGKYGLTGGVCKDSDGKDSFYKCARR